MKLPIRLRQKKKFPPHSEEEFVRGEASYMEMFESGVFFTYYVFGRSFFTFPSDDNYLYQLHIWNLLN